MPQTSLNILVMATIASLGGGGYLDSSGGMYAELSASKSRWIVRGGGGGMIGAISGGCVRSCTSPSDDDASSTLSSGGGASSTGEVSEGGSHGGSRASLGEGRASKRRRI